MGTWESLASDDPPSRRAGATTGHGARIALALGLALATYLLYPASPAVDSPVYEVGAVASGDVIAPFAFDVPKPASDLAREREQAVRDVDAVFRFVPAARDTALAQIDALASSLDRAYAARDGARAAIAAAQSNGLSLTTAEAEYFANAERRARMLAAVRTAIDHWLPAGVATGSSLDSVRAALVVRRSGVDMPTPRDSVLSLDQLIDRVRHDHPNDSPLTDRLFARLVASYVHPTLVPDTAETGRRRRVAAATVPLEQLRIRAGEKIVGAHEVVGRAESEKMRALRDAVQRRAQRSRGLARIVGAVIFDLLVIAIFGATLVLFRPALYASMRACAGFAVVYLAVLVAARLLAMTEVPHPELIPIAFAAIVCGLLFDPRIAMIAAMILAVLIGGQSLYRGTNALFLSLVGGAAAAFSVRVVRRRQDLYHSVLVIAGAYAMASIALGLTLDWPLTDTLRSAGFGALNALVSVAVAMVLVTPLEQLTGVETYLTLLEWSDLNRPLMQRLSLEAPGTYAHTVAVANLAEAACTAIGASGLLARVGAYYHDIGKLVKPQYFVENQAKGRNPHDKLKPFTSAQIIRGHVRDGLELAAKAKVPRAVRAFIAEHHGTGPISYFLDKASSRDGSLPVNAADFAYPGPVPQSAETAVTMLADGVEAATRVLSEPTPARIREVVEHIVRMRMEQGQLREAPLTLRQLEIVKEQFVRVLSGMYHNRVDYPAAQGGVSAGFASA